MKKVLFISLLLCSCQTGIVKHHSKAYIKSQRDMIAKFKQSPDTSIDVFLIAGQDQSQSNSRYAPNIDGIQIAAIGSVWPTFDSFVCVTIRDTSSPWPYEGCIHIDSFKLNGQWIKVSVHQDCHVSRRVYQTTNF